MKNIRQFKYQYDINGKLVFRLGLSKDANPILMGKPSLDAMENNVIAEQILFTPSQTEVIPNQNTGVIQEPVFIRSESDLIVDSGVVTPTVAEIPVAPLEEVVQPSVASTTRPDFQKIEISVPGMEANNGMAVDNSLNASEDPTIAQAIDAQLAGQKLYTAAEFTEGIEATKEVVPEMVPVTKESKKDYIVQNIAEIEKFRNKAAEKLMTLKTNVAELKTELDSLTAEIETFCNEISRGDANAKEYYDTQMRNYENQRQIDNSAILSTLKSEMNGFNLEAEVQDLGRAA